MTVIGEKVAAVSRWIDTANWNRVRKMTRDELEVELLMLSRFIKIDEERGEVVQCIIGVTGQNPRKGRTHSLDDIREELLDQAIAALAAWEHITPSADVMPSLNDKLDRIIQRAGIEPPA